MRKKTQAEALPVHAAMNQVLKAEREALAAVEDARRKANALLDQAQSRVRRIKRTCDRRISRLHASCAQRVRQATCKLEEEAAADETQVSLDSDDRTLLQKATLQVATYVTTAGPDDDH